MSPQLQINDGKQNSQMASLNTEPLANFLQKKSSNKQKLQ